MSAVEVVSGATSATIALIEDDDDIREVVAEVLRSEGYSVFTAPDGVHGVRLVRQLGASTGLILLDYMMPGLDGSQVIAVLKSDPFLCAIPVIVVTAVSRSVLPTGFTGIAAWLPKPVEMQHLLQVVRQVLGRVQVTWMPPRNGRALRFLARRIVDEQELELAIDKELFHDMERVARNLAAACAQNPAFADLVDVARRITSAARELDLVAVRVASTELRTFLASAARAYRPDA